MNIPHKKTVIRAGRLCDFTSLSTRFVWILGRRCNYKCSYCYVANKEEFHYPTEEELYVAAKKIIASKFDKIAVAFTGGEPTIHPTLLSLIEVLREGLGDRLQRISIQTNGSASLAFYKQLYAIYPTCSISISIHFEHIEEKAFLEKMQALNKMGFSIAMVLMYDPKQRERCKSFFEAFLSADTSPSLSLTVAALRSVVNGKYEKSIEYTQEDTEWLKNAPQILRNNAHAEKLHTSTLEEHVQVNSDPIFVDIMTADKSIKRYYYAAQAMLDEDILCLSGMHCIPAVGAIMIQADGALQCGVCNNSPISNNIYTDEISLEKLITPQVCAKTQCTCPTDSASPKWNSQEYAPLYLGGSKEQLTLRIQHFDTIKGE